MSGAKHKLRAMAPAQVANALRIATCDAYRCQFAGQQQRRQGEEEKGRERDDGGAGVGRRAKRRTSRERAADLSSTESAAHAAGVNGRIKRRLLPGEATGFSPVRQANQEPATTTAANRREKIEKHREPTRTDRAVR